MMFMDKNEINDKNIVKIKNKSTIKDYRERGEKYGSKSKIY